MSYLGILCPLSLLYYTAMHRKWISVGAKILATHAFNSLCLNCVLFKFDGWTLSACRITEAAKLMVIADRIFKYLFVNI